MQTAINRPRGGRTIRSDKVARKRGRLYESLLAVAARLFAEHGPAKVSVEDIVEHAGTSRSTFYGFFANKAELLAAALAPVFADGIARFDALERGPADAVVPGIVELYLALGDRYANTLLLLDHVDERVFPLIEEAHNRFADGLRRLMDKAEAAGLLRNDSAGYSCQLIGRVAVPMLSVYRDHPDRDQLYRESMHVLLLRPERP